MISEHDITLVKQTFSFWDKLSEQQQNYLLEHANSARYEMGETLSCGADHCLGVLLVKKGSLRIYLLSDEGREVTLYRLERGDVCILSASCILQSITFDIFIDAEVSSQIIRITSAAYSKISSENIYAENFSYHLITERFSDVMWAMQQLLFTRFDKRLAAFLLDESLKTNSDTLHMTHEQIAKYLGSAREVVSRMLKSFSTEGLVSLSRGGITLLDKKELRSLLTTKS